MNPLFACSRCFKRYPFEEIFTSSNEDSSSNQFCGDCRNATTKLKCNYCRTEFTQTGKSSSSICIKCSENIKLYGKPSACSLCSIMAAFKTDKCQRCLSSMSKYGPPVKCEICQQTCAFNRNDLRIDGKLHCWLCKLSYKRALAKAKKNDEKHRDRAKKRPVDDSVKTSSTMKLSNQSSSNRSRDLTKTANLSDIPEKMSKTSSSSNSVVAPSHHSSDHVVAVTQLREQIATLQKKLAQKDNILLQKDKEITEWKGKHFTIETEMRNKMTEQKKLYETKIDILNKKIQTQQVQIAQLSKTTKRSTKESVKEREKDNSSGTDSPNAN
ncbi:hypothetical protein PVAND_011362 [Polypedilum vanderplanki]|uniref:Protein FAM76A n=1 Tax=Polypedilum vanderplanki TaxID=319348 RepID=A0A9J6CIB6_POLVA|nr:hypothetical protein PVAND_011362 [Polypedilum vanderplanki]